MKRVVMKNIGRFGARHRGLWFFLVLVLTVSVVRISTLIKDVDPLVAGFELHHFFYGLALLIIVNLDMIFGKRHPKTYVTLSAIGIGLIADEFIFILGKFGNEQYSSTFPSAIFFIVIIVVIASVIEISQKRKKK